MKECVATAKFMIEQKLNSIHEKGIYIMHQSFVFPAPLGLGIAGLKYRNLTYDVSPQCRGCVEFV